MLRRSVCHGSGLVFTILVGYLWSDIIPSRSQGMGQFEGEYSEMGGMVSLSGFGWPLLSFPVDWSSGRMKS